MGAALGGGKGAPAPPDFQAVAQQELAANRPTQNTPWATSSWSAGAPTQTPARMLQRGGEQVQFRGTPTGALPTEQHVGLAPQLDQANQSLMGQFAQANANPLDNGAQARQHAQDAIYGQETSRLDPQWAQREHDFTTGLANQGIDPNSEAYAKAMGNFGRDRNDAYQQANYGSIMGGGQEAQRQQQMDLTSRGAPLAGMQGLQGLTGMPGFNQANLLPASIAQYHGALQNYGMQQQGKNSALGGLMGLGGTLGAASILKPVAKAAAT